MFGAVIEFRNTFNKPDPAVYFSPQFKEIFQPARTYMDNLQKDNEDGFDNKCQQDPRKFYYYDQIPSAITSFKAAVDYWNDFYSDILK
jgi:hypothetical protein